MTSPNLLLLFTDQQRFDTLGGRGFPCLRTPHLDRLTREGCLFESAYTPSAECVPARASLLFGQYPGQTRCYGNSHPMPFDTKETYAQALSRAGYHTHAVGKCHFSPHAVAHLNHGFDSRERQEEILSAPEHDEYLQHLWAHGYRHVTDPHGIRGDMYYVPQVSPIPAELHPTQWVGDRSVAYIREAARRSQPWHLFSSFIHPHPPFAPPAPWHKLYRDYQVPTAHVPPHAEQMWVHINHRQNRYKRHDQGHDLHLERMMRAYYLACVSFIDFQIGRILTTLEETGQLDQTMIVFASDHGELLGDFGCVGKRSYHDAASRLPMIARLPGLFPAGQRIAPPVSLIDVTATFLNAAGTGFHTHECAGRPLTEAVEGRPEARERTIFSQWNCDSQGLYLAIDQRWKYVWSAADQRELLFDRLEDPGETRDLAGLTYDRRFAPVAALPEMRQRLWAHLRATGQTEAIDENGWRRYPKKEMPANPLGDLLYQDHPWADQRLPGYNC